MELKKMNVVELTTTENLEIEGGFWWFDWLVNVGGPSLPGGPYNYNPRLPMT